MHGPFIPITSVPQFFTFADNHPLVVIFVTAPYCFRCKQVVEKIVGFPSDYPQISFSTVDVEELPVSQVPCKQRGITCVNTGGI